MLLPSPETGTGTEAVPAETISNGIHCGQQFFLLQLLC
jgi:hypothetical protein